MSYRVGNFTDNNSRFHSPADLGGRRVLGMGGSLTGYIRTGNAYHKDYYQGSANSRFASKKKNKFNIPDIIKWFGIMGGIAGGAALIKCGKIDFKKIYGSVQNLGKNFKFSDLKNIFGKIKNFKFSDLKNNFGSKLSSINIGDTIKDFGSKIKNLIKRP